MDTQTQEIIRKTFKGFTRGDSMSAVFHYDEQGRYIGQEQMNCLDDEPDAPATIFLKTYEGDPCYHVLTPEQMASASDKSSRNKEL